MHCSPSPSTHRESCPQRAIVPQTQTSKWQRRAILQPPYMSPTLRSYLLSIPPYSTVGYGGPRAQLAKQWTQEGGHLSASEYRHLQSIKIVFLSKCTPMNPKLGDPPITHLYLPSLCNDALLPIDAHLINQRLYSLLAFQKSPAIDIHVPGADLDHVIPILATEKEQGMTNLRQVFERWTRVRHSQVEIPSSPEFGGDSGFPHDLPSSPPDM
ncbi:hypothetical protein B0I72DRAFT_169925 [Yarrowia lipolytica]|nr:hypothetical protein B0I72DRAFT_169925 [Yarrowia lipolytica]RDW37806.1 hypothetical protein B0I73DRAFT_176457 [Yarrowia lipolytica]RDW47130.1 hypothetical protein B0I74DRAFT_167040 [Yarrowia lipolytica]RDW53357.1 hypothetical protein B0I75DRAFT_163582 [Yarrowia lipolytica]